MGALAATRERPSSVAEAAQTLASLAREGRTVRIVGARTKLDWGALGDAQVELESTGLNRILEHNRGDFTAVLEAGVPLREAQVAFAEAGQTLAWDPPLADPGGQPAGGAEAGSAGAETAGGQLARRGADATSGEVPAPTPGAEAATVGGIVATADSGPCRHRYGGVRDTLIGITVVLSDGTVARAGGKVIKNVAGYDLGKLFAGSLGTLGMIATVSVRLHPRARETATLIGASEDHERLAAAATLLARQPLEADCLDVCWEGQSGRLLVRFAGDTARERAERIARGVDLEQIGVPERDDRSWREVRSLQRSADGAVLKVSGRPTDLALLLREARRTGATVVARAALGICWVIFAPGEELPERVSRFTSALSPRACLPLDGASRAGAPEPQIAPGALALMGRVKERLDPAGCFPGLAAGAG